jgi:ABC-type phosphate/phosphonate transport system ATPase subunit
VEGVVIELLGVGVPRRNRGWLLHRICATLEAGELTTVVSADAEERHALLDTIAGHRVPDEGRVWINRVPVMPDSLGRVRRLCGDIDPGARLVEHRSLFWNALAPASGPRALGRLLRLPRRQQREAALTALERVGLRAKADERVATLSGFDRMRFLIARALARRPRHLVVRDLDTIVSADEVGGLLALLRLLARSDRLGIVVSLADGGAARAFADRMLVLGEGLLLFHGRADGLDEPRAAWHVGAVTR